MAHLPDTSRILAGDRRARKTSSVLIEKEILGMRLPEPFRKLHLHLPVAAWNVHRLRTDPVIEQQLKPFALGVRNIGEPFPETVRHLPHHERRMPSCFPCRHLQFCRTRHDLAQFARKIEPASDMAFEKIVRPEKRSAPHVTALAGNELFVVKSGYVYSVGRHAFDGESVVRQ